MLHIARITQKKKKKKKDLLNKNLRHRQLVNLSSLPTSTCDVYSVSIQLTILQANRYTHMYLSMYTYIHIYVCMYVKKKESANFLVIQQISKTSHRNITLKMTILIH